MENAIPINTIRDKLAVRYRAIYDRWFVLMDEAKAADLDGDDTAFTAITRRADKLSDIMDGMKVSAEVLGISTDELLTAVNADLEGGA